MTTIRELRAWQRRAVTNLDRAHQLSCDMIAALGVEDSLTDYSDGAVEQAENLVTALAHAILLSKLEGNTKPLAVALREILKDGLA